MCRARDALHPVVGRVASQQRCETVYLGWLRIPFAILGSRSIVGDLERIGVRSTKPKRNSEPVNAPANLGVSVDLPKPLRVQQGFSLEVTSVEKSAGLVV